MAEFCMCAPREGFVPSIKLVTVFTGDCPDLLSVQIILLISGNYNIYDRLICGGQR